MMIPDSFLSDEVRCGFMVPSAVKQAWAAQLEVLMEIDRVCKKHNIVYYADWGTLLGTVRHGGFIPWDDDLDIVMKREDYERFMNVARFDMEEGFDVQTFRNQKDFWLFMGKVVGKNRFCFEKEHLRRFHNFPYIACVDIFVLDYVYRDPKKEEERRILCKYMLGVADAIVGGTLSVAERDKCLGIIKDLGGGDIRPISDSIEMGRYLYGEVEKIFARVREDEADELTQLFPWGLKGNSLHIPKECYAKPVFLPFECIKMPVPGLYDKMLRMRYGDYMKLIKSGGGHDYPFFEGQKQNLQKVLDFKLPEFEFDIIKAERSEEEKSCRSSSYKILAQECTDELLRMKEEIIAILNVGWTEQVTSLISDSQQLAIDLGTMLEQIKGEDCHAVLLLEQYCEVLYELHEQNAWVYNDTFAGELCVNLSSLLENIITELNENIFSRKTVLFLPAMAKDWKELYFLWKEYVKTSEYDVYVVPLPYYYKDYDGSPVKVLCDASDFPTEVNALDYRILTKEYMELLHPEKIIIQNPYDSNNPVISIPEMFYSLNIRKYTDELIYVSLFSINDFTQRNFREYTNMRYYVTMPGVMYADSIYVQSAQMRQTYIDKLTEFAGQNTKAIWEKKVISIRPCDKASCLNETKEAAASAGKKKILYGISLGTYAEDEQKSEEKLARSLKIFDRYKEDIEVEIFKFPKDDTGPYVTYDIDGYAAYYGDPMPVATEFIQAGKPVMIRNMNL